jgi:hypothetical protein
VPSADPCCAKTKPSSAVAISPAMRATALLNPDRHGRVDRGHHSGHKG